jgi:hypothetical protein
MSYDGTPVAARTEIDPAAISDEANLHVEVTGATKRFHLWQQGPAWGLGWFAVSTAIVLAVIGSFRSPFSIGETSVSSAPGRHPKKKATTTTTNPPTGG